MCGHHPRDRLSHSYLVSPSALSHQLAASVPITVEINGYVDHVATITVEGGQESTVATGIHLATNHTRQVNPTCSYASSHIRP